MFMLFNVQVALVHPKISFWKLHGFQEKPRGQRTPGRIRALLISTAPPSRCTRSQSPDAQVPNLGFDDSTQERLRCHSTTSSRVRERHLCL